MRDWWKMSQKYRDGYITEINVEELDDLVKSKIDMDFLQYRED